MHTGHDGLAATRETGVSIRSVPDGYHVKKLREAEDVYELRVALDRTTWRITFWKPGASRCGPGHPDKEDLPDRARHVDHPLLRKERIMAGHSRWKTLQARRLAETGDAAEHPEYEQAGRDLRLGDQLRAIRRSRNLTQKDVAERAGISQPALSRIELGGGVPDIETLRRLGIAMGVRFHVIVGNEEAEQEEHLLVS
jgi:DNA-binding XRE family transcriptional regulator